jgi:hypothetical protein
LDTLGVIVPIVRGGDGSGSWLEVAEFFKSGSKWCGKLAVVVECGQLGLGCQQYDVFDIVDSVTMAP